MEQTVQCSRLIQLMIGIYDYRNRVYSPDLGRFLQTDPIRFDAGDVNLYRYVGNGVTRLKDPSGLCPSDEEEVEEDEDKKPEPKPEPKPKRPVLKGGGISCVDRCLIEEYGSALGWFDDLGYYGIGSAVAGVATDIAANSVESALNRSMRSTLQEGLSQGRNPSAPAQRVRDGATESFDRMSNSRSSLRAASRLSGIVGGSATVASVTARAYCQWKCSFGGYR